MARIEVPSANVAAVVRSAVNRKCRTVPRTLPCETPDCIGRLTLAVSSS